MQLLEDSLKTRHFYSRCQPGLKAPPRFRAPASRRFLCCKRVRFGLREMDGVIVRLSQTCPSPRYTTRVPAAHSTLEATRFCLNVALPVRRADVSLLSAELFCCCQPLLKQRFFVPLPKRAASDPTHRRASNVLMVLPVLILNNPGSPGCCGSFVSASSEAQEGFPNQNSSD